MVVGHVAEFDALSDSGLVLEHQWFAVWIVLLGVVDELFEFDSMLEVLFLLAEFFPEFEASETILRDEELRLVRSSVHQKHVVLAVG